MRMVVPQNNLIDSEIVHRFFLVCVSKHCSEISGSVLVVPLGVSIDLMPSVKLWLR